MPRTADSYKRKPALQGSGATQEATGGPQSTDLRSIQLLLLQAEREILQRIRAGGKPTKTDLLVQLALKEIEGK